MGKGSGRRVEDAGRVRERWPLNPRLPYGDKLLCVKELAGELGRHTSYIYAMRRDGFEMPAGLSTVNQAVAWLAKRPHFRQRPRRTPRTKTP